MKAAAERLTVWIDPSIKYHAKIKALEERVTLSAVIEELLSKYLVTRKKVKETRNANS